MSDPREYSYPTDAACAGHPHPELWDGGRWTVPPEPARTRMDRQKAAKEICDHVCPVREQCEADINIAYDEGVKGGHILPPLRTHLGGYGSVPGIHPRRAS